MERVLWPRLVATALIVGGSVSGCARTRSSTESNSESVSESTVVSSTDASISPASTGPAATGGANETDPTTAVEPTDSTSVDPTVAPPTVPETTALADPCAGFEALLGYERMMAVKDGVAPTDPACRPAVDRSRLALNTFETSLVFSEQYDQADRDDLRQSAYCGAPMQLINIFEVPVMYWGMTGIVVSDELISYQPFISEVISPGESWTMVVPGSDRVGDFQCRTLFEGIVAPTGGLAAGIDAAPAPKDDPLASDDPQVWGLALVEPDINDFDIGQFVNRIEDIHSNDVGNQIRDIASGELEARASEETFTICESEPADLGPEVTGEYAWLVYGSTSETENYRALGLFSRGSDGRWRYLGTTRRFENFVDSADPCELPPRTVS